MTIDKKEISGILAVFVPMGCTVLMGRNKPMLSLLCILGGMRQAKLGSGRRDALKIVAHTKTSLFYQWWNQQRRVPDTVSNLAGLDYDIPVSVILGICLKYRLLSPSNSHKSRGQRTKMVDRLLLLFLLEDYAFSGDLWHLVMAHHIEIMQEAQLRKTQTQNCSSRVRFERELEFLEDKRDRAQLELSLYSQAMNIFQLQLGFEILPSETGHPRQARVLTLDGLSLDGDLSRYGWAEFGMLGMYSIWYEIAISVDADGPRWTWMGLSWTWMGPDVYARHGWAELGMLCILSTQHRIVISVYTDGPRWAQMGILEHRIAISVDTDGPGWTTRDVRMGFAWAPDVP
ncbi:hypothetical protein DFH29DRAFT_881192 [Suillus ampliporus]|nr:hypothetical protein DFH29DRAFT_881192 [Suillus ampliporus]